MTGTPTPRTTPILRTDHVPAYLWPEDCFLQGGSHGLVFRRGDGGNYRTAFVEASPRDPDTFIRGEGATVAEAETAAWAKYQQYLACPGHEFEPRNYTNGAGFCKHCSMFASGRFTAAELGLFCVACHTPANWVQVAGNWYCQGHAPARRERSRLNEEAGVETGQLEQLFDNLLNDDDE